MVQQAQHVHHSNDGVLRMQLRIRETSGRGDMTRLLLAVLVALPVLASAQGPKRGIGTRIKQPPPPQAFFQRRGTAEPINTRPPPKVGPQPTSEQPRAITDALKAPAGEPPLTVLSATTLIAGTTVGAGILALPAFTVNAGFIPSSIMLLAAWAFMATTGLLIAEASINANDMGSGLISMTRKTIGGFGASLSGAAYLFLHYALLVAYIAQGGDLLLSGVKSVLPFESLPSVAGPMLFTGLFGGALALGNRRFLDQANDFLVGLVILSFVGLVAIAAPKAQVQSLLSQDWNAALTALPVMFVALVYHNVVPTVASRLQGDASKIRKSVIVGSGIPFLMFVVWNAVVLGNVGPTLEGATGGAIDPLAILRNSGAGEQIGALISAFSEVAIITSFTGFVWGLKDFFEDVFSSGKVKDALTQNNERSKLAQDLLTFALILAPPLAIATTSPDIFYSALDNAGAFGISMLFGIVPAAVAGIVRQRSATASSEYTTLVPGGNPVLVGVATVGVAVIVQKVLQLMQG